MIIQAPVKWDKNIKKFKVFLAGSIDNGKAEDWQKELIDLLKDEKDIAILNPRRDKWNPNAKESEVEKQINWEKEAMDAADIILFKFSEKSKSVITMYELGYYIHTGKCVVHCHEKFWRATNVRVSCEQNSVIMLNTLKDLAAFAKWAQKNHSKK